MRALVAFGEYELAQSPHPERARLDAEALLLHILTREDPERNRAWLLAHWNDSTMPIVGNEMRVLVERRKSGEPIQYITGECEFYGLPFRVTPDVLIPRPETEHLVEEALKRASQWQQTEGAPSLNRSLMQGWESTTVTGRLRILDIGTGSGALAVTLAHHLPEAQMTAVDLSPAALEIAKQNAMRNGVAARIRFLQSDLLGALSPEEKFDLIVSNPPYVSITDQPTLSVEVRDHEPALALFAGEDGLNVYRRLIPAAHAVIEPEGSLLLEIGCGQSKSVSELLEQSGFECIEFVLDLQGISRVACTKRP
jgi:release factor glutamine methyltransferase